MKTPARKKRALLITLAVLGLVTGFALNAGRMLVIDEPRTSDVILVLAGETELEEIDTEPFKQRYGAKAVRV